MAVANACSGLAKRDQCIRFYHIRAEVTGIVWPGTGWDQGWSTSKVGFLLERAARVFDAAGIAVRFESRPARRILHDIAHLQTAACSIGWFKTPERGAFAWFSPPIHQDAPMRVLTRRDTAARIDAQAERVSSRPSARRVWSRANSDAFN